MRAIAPAFCVLMTLHTHAQGIERKLLEQDALAAPELKTLGTFNTLSFWHDSMFAHIDTTILISDTIWMSVLDATDSVGDCSHLLLMTYSPVSHKVKALTEVVDYCGDEGFSEANDFTLYEHQLVSADRVEVAEFRSKRFDENDMPFGGLVYTALRRLTVLPDGSIDDTGFLPLDNEESPSDEPWGMPTKQVDDR